MKQSQEDKKIVIEIIRKVLEEEIEKTSMKQVATELGTSSARLRDLFIQTRWSADASMVRRICLVYKKCPYYMLGLGRENERK